MSDAAPGAPSQPILSLFQLYQHDLEPVFELMGNPAGFFDGSGFEDDPVQLLEWKEMIKAIAEHYSTRYGRQRIERSRLVHLTKHLL